jgi:hypothetical protein
VQRSGVRRHASARAPLLRVSLERGRRRLWRPARAPLERIEWLRARVGGRGRGCAQRALRRELQRDRRLAEHAALLLQHCARAVLAARARAAAPRLVVLKPSQRRRVRAHVRRAHCARQRVAASGRVRAHERAPLAGAVAGLVVELLDLVADPREHGSVFGRRTHRRGGGLDGGRGRRRGLRRGHRRGF